MHTISKRTPDFFKHHHHEHPTEGASPALCKEMIAKHLSASEARKLEPWQPEMLSANPELIKAMEKIALSYPPEGAIGSIAENFSLVRMVADFLQIMDSLDSYKISAIGSFNKEIDKFLDFIEIDEFLKQEIDSPQDPFTDDSYFSDTMEAADKGRKPKDIHLAHVNLPGPVKKEIAASVKSYFSAAKNHLHSPKNKETFRDLLDALIWLEKSFVATLGSEGIMANNLWTFMMNEEVTKALGIEL